MKNCQSPKLKSEISFSWAMSNHGLIHIDNYKKEKIWCPSCQGKMVARQGSIMRPHYAHSPHEGCGGPERIEHLLGKDIILRNTHLFLPVAKKVLHGKEYLVNESMITYHSPIAEKGMGGFVPDIIIKTEKYNEFIVEIRVTHATDYPKHLYLVNNRIPAIEIDCRGINNIPPLEVDDFVLNKAKRKWLSSPELADLIIYDMKLKKGLIKTSVDRTERFEEIKQNALEILNKWNDTSFNDPIMTTIEKRHKIECRHTKSPFLFSNTYICTLLNTYKNKEMVLSIINKKGGFKYQISNDLYKILLKYYKKDFSFPGYLDMLIKTFKIKDIV